VRGLQLTALATANLRVFYYLLLALTEGSKISCNYIPLLFHTVTATLKHLFCRGVSFLRSVDMSVTPCNHVLPRGHKHFVLALETDDKRIATNDIYLFIYLAGCTMCSYLPAPIINLLKTKRNLLYIRHQSVPRCKHFPPRL
jgi:hypothetical protein